MADRIQICPIGFEKPRVLRGIADHPCSIVYLLISVIKKEAYPDDEHYDLHDKLVQLSTDFASKIEEKLKKSGTYIPEIMECSFINYKETIKGLCNVMKAIFKTHPRGKNLEGIWINIGTATPLLATAASYIASFKTDILHLFYTSASHYTINEILKPGAKIEDIVALYEENGSTFSSKEGNGYGDVEIPVVPTERLSHDAESILLALSKHVDAEFTPAFVSQTEILEACGEKITQAPSIDERRKIKMKYRRQFVTLLERHLIEPARSTGKERKYKLTELGVVQALILECLTECEIM
ncbi:MAG TPA: DUF6293 family protein [Candidatus Lokiarchaeia archaeon]|nr:DUF6293 family protein [Candidatus Lokiarchaeia archaeon]